MLSFYDDGNTPGMNLLVDRFRDLRRQPFLNLQAPGKHVDEPGNFAEADHPAIGYVPDVAFAEKRKEMMFAQAEKFDIPDDDHLVVGDIKQCLVNQLVDIHLVAAGQETQGTINALGGVHEAIAARVLT